MKRFEERVAIVTGGGAGIGEATAMRFAAEGAAVGVADVNGDAAERVATTVRRAGGRAMALVGDVSDEAAVRRIVKDTVEELGGLDVLHNNAAALSNDVMNRDGPVVGVEREVFDIAMAVNVLGAMFMCKEAVPHMIARGGGAIVNMSSVSAIRGAPWYTVYSASKAAIVSLTRSVATQYGKHGIRCNAVAPGVTLTPRMRARVGGPGLEQALDAVLTTRLGEVADIASVVAFLASDDAAYITGQEIVADGGHSCHA